MKDHPIFQDSRCVSSLKLSEWLLVFQDHLLQNQSAPASDQNHEACECLEALVVFFRLHVYLEKKNPQQTSTFSEKLSEIWQSSESLRHFSSAVIKFINDVDQPNPYFYQPNIFTIRRLFSGLTSSDFRNFICVQIEYLQHFGLDKNEIENWKNLLRVYDTAVGCHATNPAPFDKFSRILKKKNYPLEIFIEIMLGDRDEAFFICDPDPEQNEERGSASSASLTTSSVGKPVLLGYVLKKGRESQPETPTASKFNLRFNQ